MQDYCQEISSSSSFLFRVVYYQLSTVTVNDFYRGLAANLGLEPAFRKIDLFRQIQDAVFSMHSERS